MKRAARIAELESIIAARLISIENGASPRYDDSGRVIVDMFTCGTCGQRWNDALISSRTPVPAGRCPYEYEHDQIKELERLKARRDRRRVSKYSVWVGGGEINAYPLTREQAERLAASYTARGYDDAVIERTASG